MCNRCVCSPSPRANNKGEAHRITDMRAKAHIGLVYTFALEKIRFRDLVQQSGGESTRLVSLLARLLCVFILGVSYEPLLFSSFVLC